MYDLTFLFMYKLALKLGPRVQRQLGQFESKYQRPAGEGNWHLLFQLFHLYRFSTGITHWSPTIVKKVNVFRYRASKEGWRQGRNLAEQSLGLQTPGFFGSPCNQGGCVSTKKSEWTIKLWKLIQIGENTLAREYIEWTWDWFWPQSSSLYWSEVGGVHANLKMRKISFEGNTQEKNFFFWAVPG